MANKIYEVTSINWLHSYLEARKTDLTDGDIPDSELWEISFFKDFKVRLVNAGGAGDMGEIIDFAEWMERNRGDVMNNMCLWLWGAKGTGGESK